MLDIFKEIDMLKEEIDNYKPMSKELVDQLKQYYRIGLTYTSNAIEGNSLTETETKVIIEDGITIGGKPIRDYFETIGHSEAYDFIYSLSKNRDYSEEIIKKLHELFYRHIDLEKAGKYRDKKVFISGSEYSVPGPERIQELIEEHVKKMNEVRPNLHPIEFAAIVHKDFVFIHPFIDGNGRVARLLMNLVLLQEGYSIAIIPPVLRAEYIGLLEKAHKDDNEFIKFIAERVRETQKDYLRLLKA